MTHSCPRIALLTGVSLVAVGLASPASAATTVRPGIGHTDTSEPVEDMLVICDLAPALPTSPCEYGVEATGEGIVEALVNDVASGRIEQIGMSTSGDVDLNIVSDGRAAIVAQATASEEAGLARASAVISDAIYQDGVGPGDISIDLTNDGELLIEAIADAAGGESGAAHALAVIDTAIFQTASSTGSGAGSITLTNNGELRIAATAVATGSATGATASGASVSAMARVKGISQIAVVRDVETVSGTTSAGNFVRSRSDIPTGPASVSLTNLDDVSVAADANAYATEFALARATVDAVRQRAEGTDAAISLTNIGEIDIGASADASGSDYALAAAFADGFHQTATAMGTVVQSGFTPLGGFTHEFSRLPYGDASAQLDNSGEIEITAVAHAIALSSDPDAATGVGAVAGAYVSSVRQNVAGNDASAAFHNSGSLLADASAIAMGEDLVGAQVHAAGIHQAAIATGFTSSYAYGPGGTPIGYEYATHWLGTASLTIENSGDINIGARAKANAGGPAAVDATATGVWQAARGLESHLTVDNSGSLEVSASGQVTGTSADAFVRAGGFIQQSAVGYKEAAAAIDNSGELDVSVNALANGEVANITAVALGASQVAVAYSDAFGTFVNSGDLSVSVTAEASADYFAAVGALAIGAQQQASAADAHLTMENSGELSAKVAVNVGAHSESGFAFASAGAVGMGQFATGYAVMASLSNSGSLNAGVDIVAAAEATAVALASAIGAQQGVAGSDLRLSFDNTGSLTVDANLTIEAGSAAYGRADVRGIMQSAEGATGGALITNSGTIDVGITGDVKVTGSDAIADLRVGAIGAVAQGAGELLQVVNHGEINAAVDLNAVAIGDGGFVSAASGGATGVNQSALGESAKLSLINDGVINVDVHAVASATTAAGFAWAWAKAFGVKQANVATTAFLAFDNSGAIEAEAMATATSLARRATALAIGYFSRGGGGVPAVVAVNNSGAISVAASADAAGSTANPVEIGTLSGPFDAGTAVAHAMGIFMDLPAGSSAGPNRGTLTNSGSIDVVAKAAGETMTTVIGTGITATKVTVGGSSAFAAGIRLSGGVNAMTVTNSGTISVDAITFDDGRTQAMGIAALANFPMDRHPDDILTIINSGDIVVRESIDGGQTWRRGLAINVAGNPDNFAPGLPNKAVINLLGGSIYGNIAIQQGDVINVQRAETALDGIINPVCLGASFAVDGGGGPCGVGTLFINDGGTLFLQDPRSAARSNMYDGPSYAFVETLDMRAGPDGATGTIAFGLQPANRGTQPAGTYPQLFANTAILDGTLEVRFSPTGRTSANSYFWDNVVDASSLSGTFDSCAIGGAHARSVLLGKLTCIYDDASNVDLSLARVAFDKVQGLDRNAIAVGAQLERIQVGAMPTGIAGLLSDLFLIGDAKEYDRVLSSLGGETYANYLQSFVSLGIRYNEIADEATRCGIAALDCRGSQPVRLWGIAENQRRASTGYESGLSRQSSSILGADINIGNATIVGLSAGKVGNGVRQAMSGGSLYAGGWQVGGYAALDPGGYYVRGAMTLSRFEGSSTRNVSFSPFGGSFAGTMSGDPDIKMWTLGLHAGARIGLGHQSVVTPYVNLDHIRAELGGFAEGAGWGSKAAELRVSGGRASAAYVGGGVELATRIGGFLTEANVGYRHGLGDLRSNLTAAFRGFEQDAFEIVSDAEERGTFLAGFNLSGKLGRAELKMGYAGEFNGDATRHRGDFRIILPLGREAQPPPDSAR